MVVAGFIDSVGSGTIVAGRNNAYINDLYVTSGSVITVTLTSKGSASAAGVPCVQAVTLTTGSPANGQAARVWINGAAPSNIAFNYAVIDVSGSKPL